jgi:hypothetical protein
MLLVTPAHPISADVGTSCPAMGGGPAHSGSQMEPSGTDIQQAAGLHREGWVLGQHLH